MFAANIWCDTPDGRIMSRLDTKMNMGRMVVVDEAHSGPGTGEKHS